MSKEELIEERLKEEFVRQPDKLRVDSEKCIVYGLKFQGWDSSNGRKYDKNECGKKVEVDKFIGSKINFNHSTNPISAPFESRFGRAISAYVKEDGIYGDAKYNPEHPLCKTFLWWVKNDPNAIGMSPNAMAVVVKGTSPLQVKGFRKVDSIDIVGDPATTKGLFESMGDEEQPALPEETPDDSELNVDEDTSSGVDNALAELAREIFMDEELDKKDLCKKLRALADMLDKFENSDGTLPESDNKDSKKEEKQVKESVDDVAALKAELEEYRTKEARQKVFDERKVSVKVKCKEAKLPDKVVSETFLDLLASQDNDAVVMRLIEDRKEAITLVAVVDPKSVGVVPNKMTVDEFAKFVGSK